MSRYEEAQDAWEEIHALMKEIHVDCWVRTGERLTFEVMRDLGVALFIKKNKSELVSSNPPPDQL